MKTMLLLNVDMERPGIIHDNVLIGFLHITSKGMRIDQTVALGQDRLDEIIADLNRMKDEIPALFQQLGAELPMRHQHARTSAIIRSLPATEKRNIQIGSAEHVKPGFLNIDTWPNSGIDYDETTTFANLDVRLGLPLDDASAGFVYSSHMLEHLTFEEAKRHLADIHRVLWPGGRLRMCLPDVDKTAKCYAARDMAYLERMNETFRFLGYMPKENRLYGDLMSRHILEGCTHKYFWDAENLEAALAACGFQNIQEAPYDTSIDQAVALRIETSFCIEAIKAY
ncbi:MAG: methyltransferase domain-containing protein [Alphaproteobacteria bacterium]|nr:methyltransferase domain-containing protein [Alphaproteobacteria bacterium]